MKTAAIYVRVSTADQHVETQLLDLREFAAKRGFEVVKEYEDKGISGSKARRPGLDALMADARRKRFDVVLVAAFDRVARNVRHFLEVLDELNHLGIEFVSLRENIDTGGPLGRAMVVIVGAIAQVEKQAIVERVKAGMRRARLEGRQIGRAPLRVDRDAILRDRQRGLSLNQIAKAHRISKASVPFATVMPLASLWLCRTPEGAQVVFWAAPWSACFWSLILSVLIGSRFWRGRGSVLLWRAERGGYVRSCVKSTGVMFLALFASYGAEFAYIFLLRSSPDARLFLPCATYAPAAFALWRTSR